MPRKRRPSELMMSDEYDALLRSQGGTCAICGNKPKPGGRRFAVDHDHKTGAIRGLLCFRCNRILPHYADADWLARAAEYVRDGTLYVSVGAIP